MGERTAISWCDHTFNAWEGCEKISPGCKFCYAAELNKWLRKGENWGPATPRRLFGDAHWAKPLAWDRAARATGVRRRVFCSSVADVFEDRPDLVEHRDRLWALIKVTMNLDWLLLTKRPENVEHLMPEISWLAINGWLGVTAEDDEHARSRIPLLRCLSDRFAKTFVSYEPALGRIDWRPHLDGHNRPDWVIFGDESGRRRRDAELDWARETRDACATAGVAFHFKQWCGDDVPGLEGERTKARKIHLPILDGVQHAAFPKGAHP